MGLAVQFVCIFLFMSAVSSSTIKGFLQRAVRAVSGPGADITICIGNEGECELFQLQ